MRRNGVVLVILAVALVLAAAWWLRPAPEPSSSVAGPQHAAPPAPDVASAPVAAETPEPNEPEDALTRCAFERDLLSGQVSRCGGVAVEWPPDGDPAGIEAQIRAQIPDGLDLELYCDESTARTVSRRWNEYFPGGDIEMGDSDRAHLD